MAPRLDLTEGSISEAPARYVLSPLLPAPRTGRILAMGTPLTLLGGGALFLT